MTGTGKTHTMRGGKALADRGVIPRHLSSIYRRARKIEKDGDGETQVEVSMSYYEIYNDRVYDLFEPPEHRTPAGLPIRDNNGKTVVVGLTERPCTTLKEFEKLYDEANVNRSTSATKLNAHSSRSHAILCVKITQITGDEVQISTASAIDLAGSEDNRRTDNNKDRLVESSAINKSLFVLAQCVEAISKKQARIPYRESKMTRILSLGQNNGYTVMILNLAPVRSYHLDTLSSLNFANRTKKIEVNEVENQPFFKEGWKSKLEGTGSSALPPSMNRQPLRPKLLSQNSHLKDVAANVTKPVRQFSVYSDKTKPSGRTSSLAGAQARSSTMRSPKRTSSEAMPGLGRPAKFMKPNEPSKFARAPVPSLSKDAIEALIERKVNEALAERADHTTASNPEPIPDEVQKRLDALEKRVEGQENERAEGLQYLLMAKQHHVRGEDASALRMFQLAMPHFPGNEKLARKVAALQEKIASRKVEKPTTEPTSMATFDTEKHMAKRKPKAEDEDSYLEAQDQVDAHDDDDEFIYRPRTKIRRPQNVSLNRPAPTSSLSHPNLPPEPARSRSFEPEDVSEDELALAGTSQTPRTKQLLGIINSKSVSQIKLLKGVGAKKAEAIVNCLCDLGDDTRVASLGELAKMKGVGVKTVENMRTGLMVERGIGTLYLTDIV